MKTGLTVEQFKTLIKIMDLENVFNKILFEGGEVWQSDTNHFANFIGEITTKKLNEQQIIELLNEKKEVIKTIQNLNKRGTQ